jgi:hypothetical protein
MLKFKLADCSENMMQFLYDIQAIGYDLAKSMLLDAALLKYKPSRLAAAQIFLGFQLQFEVLLKHQGTSPDTDALPLDLGDTKSRDFIRQVSVAYGVWHDILENVFCIPGVPMIQKFSQYVFERQLTSYKQYKETFPNVYKDRCADYFTLPT